MANEFARHLRKNQTIADARLWEELRELRREGYHFRRQAPLGAYVVDFVCFDQKVVIEVDGFQHFAPEHASKDAARDADLTWRGFEVLRFTNSDLAESLDGVMVEVLAALGAAVRFE